uniref:Uncharacterized protein n=1 Tax=Rhizophora mucronata TaxID=61149 RepID=A0A2P2NBS8_RHIMU
MLCGNSGELKSPIFSGHIGVGNEVNS